MTHPLNRAVDLMAEADPEMRRSVTFHESPHQPSTGPEAVALLCSYTIRRPPARYTSARAAKDLRQMAKDLQRIAATAESVAEVIEMTTG